LLGNHFVNPGSSLGRAEKETLPELAAAFGQLGHNRGLLDAFRHRLDPESLGQYEDRVDDGSALGVVFHMQGEGLVDLDLADGEVAQIPKARVAGAKVVEGDLDTCLRQLLKDSLCRTRVLEQGGFGNLEDQPVRAEAAVGKDRHHLQRKRMVVQLDG